MGTRNLILGMHQLIIREREQLDIRFVGDDEIWQDEDTALPNYKGYEHFILERGYPLLADDGDRFSFVSQTCRKHYSTMENKQDVFEYGYEFISIMKLAALSIGTASVYGKPSFSDLTELFPTPETDLFWLHLIHSSISLSMASDRLRTFFIKFVLRESEEKIDKKLKKQFGELAKELKSKGKKPPEQYVYINAFHCSLPQCLLADEFKERLSELQGLLNNIANIRLKRNSFVHKYASREAMIQVGKRDSRLDHADVFKAFTGDINTSDYIEELVDAYKVLVRAGNFVFLLEKGVTE